MYREDMMKIIEKICSKYGPLEIKKAHKELKQYFGRRWVGAKPVDGTCFDYTLVDDDNDFVIIRYDFWYRTIE